MNRNQMISALTLCALAPISLGDTLTVGPNLTDYDYLTVTAAIAGAASGDEILITPGLYPENLEIVNKDLTLRNAGGGVVTIYGQGLNRCLRTAGTTTDVAVYGLTFTDGFSVSGGAGVSIEGGSHCDLTDCVIENNHTDGVGGGLYISYTATITNTIIRNNTSDGNGGGVYITGGNHKNFVNCTIELNTGLEGGGMAYGSAGDIMDMSGCTFSMNTATSRGGAIAVLGTSSVGIVDVVDCVFDANHADGSGGAIWISDQDVFHALDSIFSNNTAVTIGGAIKNEQISETVNCTFVGNDVEAAGVNDTFESNRSDANTNLLNCIVVNASAGSHAGPGELRAFYSLLPEAPSDMPDTNGNFNANPMFVDAPNGDYRLSSGSAAIDAGNSRGSLGAANIGIINVLDVPFDLGGDVRNLDDPSTPNTGVSTWELCIDLGAFEYQPPSAPTCAADINGDGVLDFFDVSAFLSAYSAGCP